MEQKKERKKLNVLFIYPTVYKVTGLPVGLASLAAVVKQEGHRVKIFETTFYPTSDLPSQNETRHEKGMSKRVTNEVDHIWDNTSSLWNDFDQLLDEFPPDLLGVSILEPNYEVVCNVIKFFKRRFPKVPIAAGGVFPIVAPKMIIDNPLIDLLCVGEGEGPIVELCKRIESDGDLSDIPGFWGKKPNGEIVKNRPVPVHNCDELPFPDYSEFDERLFHKPMQGKLFKMINVETSRGCPYACTYCSAPILKDIFKKQTNDKYYRKVSPKKIRQQLEFQVKKYNPDFIYFSSETFLALTPKEFDDFIEIYKDFRIPFWFQTRFETINGEWIEKLKEVGMYWMTIGLEHGNQKFRAKMIKRFYSNDMVLKKMKILADCGVGTTLNNILGFPRETRDLVFDTIELNKACFEINNRIECNIFLFTPFHGCELHDISVEDGLYPPDVFTSTDAHNMENSVLDFPQDWKDELKGLLRTFNLYVELPRSYWPQIRIAEQCNEEGAEMRRRLFKIVEGNRKKAEELWTIPEKPLIEISV